MSEHHLPAVTHAIRVHAGRAQFTREDLLNEARGLAEWGVFSNLQIAAVTGLRPILVNGITGKTDKTGGKLDPAALPLIAEVIHLHARGEIDHGAVKRALVAGCSSTMLARLTGQPQTTLSRWARQAA